MMLLLVVTAKFILRSLSIDVWCFEFQRRFLYKAFIESLFGRGSAVRAIYRTTNKK